MSRVRDYYEQSKMRNDNNTYYAKVQDSYKKLNADIANRIIALSITSVGVLFIICKEYKVKPQLIYSLIGFFITIALKVVNDFLTSKHYEQYLDGKIARLDYRLTFYGRSAEFIYWCFGLSFLLSGCMFVVALFRIV